MVVMYIRSTGEHVSATIIGPSTRGGDFFHVKYMRNGHELEHHAPVDHVLFPIRRPSPKPSQPSPKRGRSSTRSESPPVRASPAPAAPLPLGWKLRTSMACRTTLTTIVVHVAIVQLQLIWSAHLWGVSGTVLPRKSLHARSMAGNL